MRNKLVSLIMRSLNTSNRLKNKQKTKRQYKSKSLETIRIKIK